MCTLCNSRLWNVQGTLRVLLVLLHDFPEFLCQYHFPLCDCIPPPCIQARHWQAICSDCHLYRLFCVWPDQLPWRLYADNTR